MCDAVALAMRRLLDETVNRLMQGDDAPKLAPSDVTIDLPNYLPDDYRRFLLRSNGGSLRGHYCFENGAAFVWVNSVGGLQGAHSLRAARACYQGHSVRIPRALLWIMDDLGGNAVCLGLTGKHRGRVYFWDHDEEPDPDQWDGEVETAGNIRLLADSFTEFVAGLRER